MTHFDHTDIHIDIPETHHGHRIDKAIAELQEDLSRSRIKALIEDGAVLLNGAVLDQVSVKVTAGDEIVLHIPPAEDPEPQPENIPLNIVFEDDDLIVLNKHVGLIVHPGAGNPSGTLVNALLHHCGDTLSGIGGVKRPGIVHRLDKETSGLMVVAKNDFTHQGLAAQLEDRSLSRRYVALVWGNPMPIKGSVDASIGRHKTQRQKMTIGGASARSAVTHYHAKEMFGAAASLVECTLETGRTHQIRVHMAHIRHPLIGDPTYGAQDNHGNALMKKAGLDEVERKNILNFGRQALHSGYISFIHPRDGQEISFETAMPSDMAEIHKALKRI